MNAPTSATSPLASVENPNSFGSWPTKITVWQKQLLERTKEAESFTCCI